MSTNRAASSSQHVPIASGCEDPAGDACATLTPLERRLLDDYQRDFPIAKRPFSEIAQALDSTEADVLNLLAALRERGFISRVGPVFAPHSVGYSLLAAMAVPAADVERIAALVNEYPQVNHNYEREHAYNLWFVLTGETAEVLENVLVDMERRSGLSVLRLPLERPYHIDLGFSLWR